jgi:hypothetical protein
VSAVWRSSSRSVMLRQEELAFIKALSTFQVSLAVLKELSMARSRTKKKPLVPAGNRSTMPAGGARVPQRTSSQLAGKCKANELASSGDLSEPANRRVPRLGRRLYLRHPLSRANKLQLAAGNSYPPGEG